MEGSLQNCKQCNKTRLSTNTENITILIHSITYVDVRRKYCTCVKKTLLLDGLVIIEFVTFGNKASLRQLVLLPGTFILTPEGSN